MNAKQLKALRKMLRRDGHDCRDVEYTDSKPRTLKQGCGRQVYKHMKAALA